VNANGKGTVIIYFFQSPHIPTEVKIGVTTTAGLPARYNAHSAMGPVDVLALLAVPSGATEKDFFREFAKYHIERERFQYRGRLEEYVKWCASRPFCATSIANVDSAYPAPSMFPWHRPEEEEEESPDRLFMVEPMRRSLPESLSDDWQTAPLYLDAVRDVLGEIHLDPCSNPDYNRIVRARYIFTIHDDGLSHRWETPTLWLNPPFGGQGGDWVAKLLTEYEAGRTEEAILTVPTRATTNQWFDPLWEFPICFTNHRPFFRHPDGTWGSAPGGHVFVYVGVSHEELFLDRFREFGAAGVLAPPLVSDRKELRRRAGWGGAESLQPA
jgi:hypothetical protein